MFLLTPKIFYYIESFTAYILGMEKGKRRGNENKNGSKWTIQTGKMFWNVISVRH